MHLKTMDEQMLIARATEARAHSYTRYSDFAVGAALLCADGQVFVGVNIENGSYGATICAERSAFASAISAGAKDFAAIAVVGGRREEPITAFCPPCGICRQFMSEFCAPDFIVLLWDGERTERKTLGELLPAAFAL